MQRLFTVEEANATLPLVRRIVQDLVMHFARWKEIVREYELAASEMQTPEEAAKLTTLERRVQAAAAEIDGFGRELADLGIVVKDRSIGLIDFPAVLAGRMVWLCWRLDEPVVGYWHEWDEGFTGRQRLDPSWAQDESRT